MRNADEHKKLLAQIAELEKNSVNYFDVEKEFFLIDSNNLSQIRPKLYGYSIQATGIYEDDNLTPEAIANLDGRGCYVYVEVRDGKITIKQDLNGCWGIYLFRHGDYFAMSNSFFRLLDHIKYRYPLTVNRDYCNYLMVDDVSVQSYSQTAVNEIQLVARNAIMHINIAKKNLDIELIDYKEHSVPLDSEKGLAILDRWVEFWSNVFRGVAQHTKFIQADLTGGFDSRIHFVPLLHSGIDLSKIKVNSNPNNSNPVWVEDYAIASQIAEHYGFKLNQSLPSRQFLNYTLDDTWNIDLYAQQTVRNLPMLSQNKKGVDKLYHLKGLSGEVFRKTWHMPPQKFIDKQCLPTKRYSPLLAQELNHSIQTIVKSVFQTVCDKYRIEDKNSIEIPQYLYHETRTRNHCGKENLIFYLKNVISIIPAYDSEMQTLQLKTKECTDYNLLMVLLFTRYAPDLLKIRFDKFHEAVDLETLVPYAQKINERFPRRVTTDKPNSGGVFHLQPRDLQTEKIIADGKNNPSIPRDLPEDCLKATFELSKTYNLFTDYFDKELYDYAAVYYDNHLLRRNRPMYAICSIARALENVKISKSNHLSSFDLKRLLEEENSRINENENAQIVDKFKRYFTARVDIKFFSTTGDFQILSTSDDKADVRTPAWFQKNGIGYQIQSYVGELKIIAKATVDGKIQLSLKGLDVRNPEDKSKRVPYWIDYTKFIVNGEVIFNELTPTWHDKSYMHNMDAKADDEIEIQVEWLPHRSDT